MRRLLLALPITATLLVSSPAAPIPADVIAPPIFPTAVGTKWLYRSGPQEWSEEITAAESRNGVAVVSILKRVTKGQERTEDWRVEVSAKGIYVLDNDTPLCWFKSSAVPGDEWKRTGAVGLTTVRVLAPERVTVPAGTYRTIPMEMTSQPIPGDGLADLPGSTSTCWFAPGVGFVKMAEGGVEVLLLSFTPGRR